MKKVCVCVFIIWATCSKVFAEIPVYDTISPINLTINSFERMKGTASEALFTEALRHYAVAIYEREFYAIFY